MTLGITGIQIVECAVAALAIFWVASYFTNKKDPRYPRGPKALPILGNLLDLIGHPEKSFNRWAQEYGSAFSIRIGSERSIVLNDPNLIREVFNDSRSAGRSPNPILLAFAGGGNNGIVFNEGPHWESQKKFTLRKMRDFGFAKRAMEGMIKEEVNSFMNWIEKRLNKPITGNRIFNGAVVNTLWNIVAGDRNEWDAEPRPEIIDRTETLMDKISDTIKTGLFYAPSLRYFLPDLMGWTAYIKSIDDLNEITNKSIEDHLQKLDPNDPQDLIDHFLIEEAGTTDPSSSFYKHVGDKNLMALIPDLFVAGSETTSHTLSFALLFLAHNPEVQRKFQVELDNVIGRNRQAELADKINLPYTDALVMEVLRKPSVVNIGLPHKMLEDAEYQGHLLPKNTTIIANLYWVNNDPSIWGDPENFRPERFLSKDEKQVIKHDALIPFSIGKRMCLGKSLAEDSIFLFLTAIFQKYTMKPDPGSTGQEILEENIMPKARTINEPPPFKVVITARP